MLVGLIILITISLVGPLASSRAEQMRSDVAVATCCATSWGYLRTPRVTNLITFRTNIDFSDKYRQCAHTGLGGDPVHVPRELKCGHLDTFGGYTEVGFVLYVR